MVKRINCFSSGCDICKNGVYLKKNFWGDKIYECILTGTKHQKVYGENCGSFICTNYGTELLCNNCTGGYTKQFKKA